MLYTPEEDLERFGDIDAPIDKYNGELWFGHRPARDLVHDKKHVFIQEYENDSVAIVEELQAHAKAGIGGYTQAVERWLTESPSITIDDPVKEAALKALFANRRSP